MESTFVWSWDRKQIFDLTGCYIKRRDDKGKGQVIASDGSISIIIFEGTIEDTEKYMTKLGKQLGAFEG